jgi:hypothetical protein
MKMQMIIQEVLIKLSPIMFSPVPSTIMDMVEASTSQNDK